MKRDIEEVKNDALFTNFVDEALMVKRAIREKQADLDLLKDECCREFNLDKRDFNKFLQEVFNATL